MEMTNVVFNLPNTTSQLQALDGGILANFKAKCRVRLVKWLLERLYSDDCLSINKVTQAVRQAITWANDSCRELESGWLWYNYQLLEQDRNNSSEDGVEESVMSELSFLLLHFAASTEIEVLEMVAVHLQVSKFSWHVECW